jgi:hypothetical protein
MNNNGKVAAEIVTKLKAEKLIVESDAVIENKIANGTIKENDWKVFLEQQIREIEKEKNKEKENEGSIEVK